MNRHGIGRGILSPLCLPIPPSGRGLLCSWQLLRRQGAGVARRGPSRYTAPGSAVTERPVKDVRPRTAALCPGHAAGLRLGVAEDGEGPSGQAREAVTACQAARRDVLGACPQAWICGTKQPALAMPDDAPARAALVAPWPSGIGMPRALEYGAWSRAPASVGHSPCSGRP